MASEEEVQAQREQAQRELTNRELNDVRVVVSTPEGRRWYWKAMAEARTFAMTFAGTQREMTDFNEGRRSMGNNFFHDLIAAKPEAFLQMQRENAALVNQQNQSKAKDEETQ